MIPVIWWKQCRGNWDHGLLMNIFDQHPEIFVQYNENLRYMTGPKNAIVIVAGKPDTKELRDYLENINNGLVILTSEEDAYFDWKAAIPVRFTIWTQYYSPSTKSEITSRLLLGAPNRISKYKINRHLPKKYLWSFVGQVQNPFRQQCVEALKFWGTKDSFLREVEMFGGHGANGMEYQEYLDIMCQSKYVICPAGSMCVDSFRLYEALECGAIPITDKRSPRDPDGFNYWDEVCRPNGIIQVDSWKEIGTLLFDLENHFIPYDRNGDWWFMYKKIIEQTLVEYATR